MKFSSIRRYYSGNIYNIQLSCLPEQTVSFIINSLNKGQYIIKHFCINLSVRHIFIV